ncbi:MAG: restriction endonuclease [Candidatus Bathyarchaeota archaeon]|nr:MAG: restriction endonuclease [Candidatus Bathyarchaeota archaeon]
MGNVSILDLAMKFFRLEGYRIERDVVLEGLSGLPRRFDLVIQRDREKRLVWIKDWKRTAGVNMVINLDRASADVGLPNPIIISQKFSGHAKAYANRRAITLLTKRQILRRLG